MSKTLILMFHPDPEKSVANALLARAAAEIDGVEVVFARHNHSATHDEDRNVFSWTIAIGGSANTNTGRQASWTSLKTLKMQFRPYSTSANTQRLHSTYYWDGVASTQFSMPRLTIQAIA